MTPAVRSALQFSLRTRIAHGVALTWSSARCVSLSMALVRSRRVPRETHAATGRSPSWSQPPANARVVQAQAMSPASGARSSETPDSGIRQRQAGSMTTATTRRPHRPTSLRPGVVATIRRMRLPSLGPATLPRPCSNRSDHRMIRGIVCPRASGASVLPPLVAPTRPGRTRSLPVSSFPIAISPIESEWGRAFRYRRRGVHHPRGVPLRRHPYGCRAFAPARSPRDTPCHRRCTKVPGCLAHAPNRSPYALKLRFWFRMGKNNPRDRAWLIRDCAFTTGQKS